MRLVRYIDGSDGRAVELHPLMTVVSGLDEAARERLIAAVSALPSGNEPGATGQLEVHGICLDLSRESLELLELDADIDVVLRARDMPGIQPDPPPEALPDEPPRSSGPKSGFGSFGFEAASDAGDELMEAVAVADRQVAEARAALAEVESSLPTLRDELSGLAGERERVAAACEEARAHLDSYAEPGLRVAQDALEAVLAGSLEAGRAPTIDPAVLAERAEIMGRLDQLIGSAGLLKRELRTGRSLDPSRVRNAHQALELAASATEEPVPEALDLAARLEGSAQRMSTINARRAGSRQRLHDLTERRDAAYDALVVATRNLRAPELDPQLVDELESVHDEIFELDGRTGRIGGGKARRRMLELKEHEATILERLGFDTWSSYVMGVSSNTVDAERHRRYEVAKATYELAEDELARAVEAPMLDDPELTSTEQEYAGLLDEARRLLGTDPGADPIGQLRAMRHATVVSNVSVPEAAEALQQELFAAGAEVPPRRLSPTELLDLAATWLDGTTRALEQLPDLEARHDRLEAEIAELAARLEALPEAPVLPVGPTADPAAVAEAREQVAECERRVRRHHAAEAELVELLGQDEALSGRAGELESTIAALEDRLGEALEGLESAERSAEAIRADQALAAKERAERVERERSRAAEAAPAGASRGVRNGQRRGRRSFGADPGGADSEAVEWYVLARLAQQRSLSFVGSVPMLIDDAFQSWTIGEIREVFGRLARMSEVIQMIYLTDDEEVASWARGLGPDRAAVVDAGALQPA